jgi:tetratricopeptide (TPR) repeat protein
MRIARWLIPLLLVVVTALTFWPALSNDFVDWDDYVNFVRNTGFRGLGWEQIRWDLTNTTLGHYIPITWLTLSVDYALWGMNPFGYHLTNLILHAANVLLFYAVAMRLLAPAMRLEGLPLGIGGAAAALFFGVHPLRAESVAWVTERRDVLSAFFFLITVLAYLVAVRAEGARRRWLLAASVATYALALGSKSIVMTLPLVLVILDVYPLRRLTPRGLLRPEQRAVLLEKIPYLALAAAGAAISLGVVYVKHYLTPLEWPMRIAVGLYSTWFYATTTLLPYGLSPVYELPVRLDPYAWPFLRAALVVVVVTALTLLARRRAPWALAAWVMYSTILAPVAGFIHAGHQLVHDRYSYLSCLPWAVLVGAAAAALVDFARRARIRRSIAVWGSAVLAGWAVVLATFTWQQVQVWHDTEALWAYAVDSEPTCSMCHNNLGVALGNKGHLAAAVYHLQRATQLRPERARNHMQLGLFLLKMNRRAEAMHHLGIALRLDPAQADTLTIVGVALLSDGKPRAALAPLRSALSLEPEHILARTNFGTALAKLGDDTSAITQYTRAIAIDPAAAPPRYSLGSLLTRRGDIDGALSQYEIVKRLDPKLGDALRLQLQEAW